MTFPATIETLSQPSASADTATATRNNLQADVSRIVTALETKVGIDDSADANSLDYKIAHAAGGQAFPVGALFLSVVSTNPATLLGYGTWSAFGAGRVLVGLDSGDADFDTVEETGGAKAAQASAQTFGGNALATHQHNALSAGTPSGTNTLGAVSQAVTGISIAASGAGSQHSHTVGTTAVTPTTHSTQGAHTHDSHTMTASGSSGATRASAPVTHSSQGGHAHDNHGLTWGPANESAHTHAAGAITEPNGGAGHSHGFTQPTFSGNALGTHQHDALSAGTPSGTNTPGAATSVVQPYIVVYMWKRTA